MISVFPQRKPGGKDVIRIWNSQLIAYAGYPCPQDPKVFIGDRGNVTFTQFCQSLGWKGKGGKCCIIWSQKNQAPNLSNCFLLLLQFEKRKGKVVSSLFKL